MMTDAIDVQSEVPQQPSASAEERGARNYLPLHETLRLYAGWLLAWYAVVYALGSYQHMRPLPFRFPLAEALFLSPLVLSFTLAAFLYLLLGSVHRAIGGGKVKGLFLLLLGVGVFAWYRMNVA